MNSAWSIRKFLLVQPRAALIRLSSSDQEPAEMKPSRRSWSKTAESIHALQPELIELLDEKGRVIRAMRPEQDLEQSQAAPDVPKALETDPETARITHFANLLHRAYEHSTEIAFNKMVELVERMGDRSDAIEARLERTEAEHRRTLRDQVEDAFDRAAEMAEGAGAEGDFKQQMIAAFMQGQLAQHQEHAAARSNGAAKPNGKGK